MNSIINRVVFKYTGWDIAKEFVKCIWCRKLKTIEAKKENRQQFLYYKAREKLEKNFDALSLLRFMQQMQLLAPILLDQNQKLLMHFQKKQVIDTDTSSEDSDIDDLKTIQYLNGKNPFIKLMIIGRINQRVKEMLSKQKFNEIDTKLIKGIFKKSTLQKPPQKNLKQTFHPYSSSEFPQQKTNILRKFKDFVLRESVDDLGIRRKKTSVLESLDHLYERNTGHEIIETTRK